MSRTFFIQAAATLCFCGPAMANEFGQVTATLDGTERTWYTIYIQRGDEITATATLNSGQTTDLHIQSHPRPAFTTDDVLIVDVMYLGDVSPGGAPFSIEVMYLEKRMSGPIWGSEGAARQPTLAIESLDLGDDEGHVAGGFSAQLCFIERIGADPDTGKCKDVEGRFDTRLQIEK